MIAGSRRRLARRRPKLIPGVFARAATLRGVVWALEDPVNVSGHRTRYAAVHPRPAVSAAHIVPTSIARGPSARSRGRPSDLVFHLCSGGRIRTYDLWVMSRERDVSGCLIGTPHSAMTSIAIVAPSHPCCVGSGSSAAFWSQIWSQDPPLEPASPRLPVPSRRPGAARPRGRPWAALDPTAPEMPAPPTVVRVVALREVVGMARPHPGDAAARRGHAVEHHYASHAFEVCRGVFGLGHLQLVVRSCSAMARSGRARTAVNETRNETIEDHGRMIS